MSRRVLIVDDDANLRRTLADILRLKGYDPFTVSTGAAALESVVTDPPAVALIDLRLEDMSGLEVLRGLKEMDDSIACIVLTGYASQSSAIDAVNLGAYSYVQKPPNIDQLLLTIQRAIEKQTADLALRQSQALLYATGRMAKVGGWEIDVESRTLVWTEEIYHIHGVDPSFALTLEASLSFYPLEVRPLIQQAFADLLESGLSFDLEVPFAPATGEHLWVHLMGKPDIEDASGPPRPLVKVSGTFQDITERKQAEEALRRSNRRLEEALAELREAQEQVIGQERMAAVGQLAAGLAHEYNNIMATIILYADMMLRNSALSRTDRDRIAAVYDQGRRAADLTQQILDFSRKAILRKQDIVVDAVLQDLEHRLRSMLPEQIALVIESGEVAWRMSADPDRLRQALMNIALNARDAMTEGGTLRIWVEALSLSPDAVPPLPELRSGDWLVFHLRDTGTGIEPEVLPHIFEPFFTTRSPMCSGLGLSQVYGIVRQHNGTVDVRTQVGEGTTLSLYLPALPRAGTTVAANATDEVTQLGDIRWGTGQAASPSEGERALTLVIEEHELVRGALVAALESLNYPSLAFGSVEEAVGAAQTGSLSMTVSKLDPHRVKLILGCTDTDVRASYGSGAGGQFSPSHRDRADLETVSAHAGDDGSVKFVRDLKARFPRAQIVLIGDQIPNREIHAMLRSGLIRWLEKPIDLVKLAEVLAEARL